jgi:hypothetical protein
MNESRDTRRLPIERFFPRKDETSRFLFLEISSCQSFCEGYRLKKLQTVARLRKKEPKAFFQFL